MMCSQMDAPDQHDPPTPVRPRTLVLSGAPVEPQPSVALAVLGEMLNDAERNTQKYPESDRYWAVQTEVLRRARDRVARAEAEERL